MHEVRTRIFPRTVFSAFLDSHFGPVFDPTFPPSTGKYFMEVKLIVSSCIAASREMFVISSPNVLWFRVCIDATSLHRYTLLHWCNFECCVSFCLIQTCADARLKRWKVEETNHLIHHWKSSNPSWDWHWFFFCQLCLKAFCLIQVIQIKWTLMVFVWYTSLYPMVEFNLQNCISFKVVQRWDCDGIPKPYCIQFLFMVCCFFPHNRYSHNCWLPLFCHSQVKLSWCCTSFEIRMFWIRL